jgi:hypothetical protein
VSGRRLGTGAAGRVAGTLAASALAGVMAAACGISANSGPNVIPKKQVPFHLLAPEVPTTTTTTRPPSTFSVPVDVYFVSPNRQKLVSSARSVAPPETLTEVLDALLAGPTTIETDKNVGTAINSDVRLIDAKLSDGVATVDFNGAFSQISGTQQVLAVAQVVFTVTGQLGADTGVQFEIAGNAVPVPIASGVQASGPVHLLQYVTLAPTAPTTGTTAAGGTASASPAATPTSTSTSTSTTAPGAAPG